MWVESDRHKLALAGEGGVNGVWELVYKTRREYERLDKLALLSQALLHLRTPDPTRSHRDPRLIRVLLRSYLRIGPDGIFPPL